MGFGYRRSEHDGVALVDGKDLWKKGVEERRGGWLTSANNHVPDLPFFGRVSITICVGK